MAPYLTALRNEEAERRVPILIDEVLQRHASRTVVIPMPAGAVRSLNLATAAGIVVYEALRQLHAW